MVKIHSNRAFFGNIALVVFCAFLVTLVIGIAPGQAEAAVPAYDASLEWEGASTSAPDAAVLDKNNSWQETSAQVVTDDSTHVTFEIQVLTDDFDNILFKIFDGETLVETFGPDDLTSIIYNDISGTVYQVYQVVYDWVYSSGLDLDNNYTLGVYCSGVTPISITLDLEAPPPQGGGGGGGGGSSEVNIEIPVNVSTTADGTLLAGGDLNATGKPGEEASATLVVDSAAVLDQIARSQVNEVVFSVPEQVTLVSKTTPITEAAVDIPADTLAQIFAADKDVVFDLAGIEIQLPPGAIDLSLFADQNVNLSFSINRLPEGSTPAPGSAAYKIAGEVYTIEIGVTRNGSDKGNISTFNTPITLALPYDPAKLGGLSPDTLGIYRLTDGVWEDMGGTADPSTGTVSVTRTSLSTYTVMANADLQTTPTAGISDITGHWAENAIRELIALQAISGYPDGTFKPDNSISRAEFASILVKALQLAPKEGVIFDDTAAHWAKAYISTASAYGIIEGYSDSQFGPDDPITREQMAVMIIRATGLESDSGQISYTDASAISSWAQDAVTISSSLQILTGYPDNSFKPQANATRAEASTVIIKALKASQNQ